MVCIGPLREPLGVITMAHDDFMEFAAALFDEVCRATFHFYILTSISSPLTCTVYSSLAIPLHGTPHQLAGWDSYIQGERVRANDSHARLSKLL